MKWGVITQKERHSFRNKHGQFASKKSKKQARKEEAALVKEKSQKLTNTQMRKALERKKLQEEYIRAFTPQQKVSAGKKLGKKILEGAGDALYAAYKDTLKSTVKAFAKKEIEKKFNIKLREEKKTKSSSSS